MYGKLIKVLRVFDIEQFRSKMQTKVKYILFGDAYETFSVFQFKSMLKS